MEESRVEKLIHQINSRNAKKVALLLVLGFSVYHVLIHLKYGKFKLISSTYIHIYIGILSIVYILCYNTFLSRKYTIRPDRYKTFVLLFTIIFILTLTADIVWETPRPLWHTITLATIIVSAAWYSHSVYVSDFYYALFYRKVDVSKYWRCLVWSTSCQH